MLMIDTKQFPTKWRAKYLKQFYFPLTGHTDKELNYASFHYFEKGKYIKIKFCTQLPTPMPQFAFFANLPQYVRDPYRRFIENKLRENFDFNGVPIDVYFRQK